MSTATRRKIVEGLGWIFVFVGVAAVLAAMIYGAFGIIAKAAFHP